MEVGDLPDKDFRYMVIKMLIKLERRMHEQSENFNDEMEHIKNTKQKSQSRKYSN